MDLQWQPVVNKGARIFVAGHQGLVGSAVIRALSERGHSNLLTATRDRLDLCDQAAVEAFFKTEHPEIVVLCAARVGGIHANSTRPAEFIRDNLLIQTHVIDAAYRHGTKKFLFLGSSCIYPRLARQPIAESELLAGPLEKTNEAYAIAKIAGAKMCQAYRQQYDFDAIVAMPTNLFGDNDDFSDTESHVLPALIARFHDASERGAETVTVWGSGKPRREFLHADDCAAAIIHLLEHYSGEEPVNIGTGEDLSIGELATLIAAATGFVGRIEFDVSKPDGTPRKLLDVSKMRALGWSPQIPLASGIARTCQSYQRWMAGARKKPRAARQQPPVRADDFWTSFETLESRHKSRLEAYDAARRALDAVSGDDREALIRTWTAFDVAVKELDEAVGEISAMEAGGLAALRTVSA